MSKRRAIKCKGHLSSGDPCTWYAMEGQLVCRRHGGSSPQARAAAEVKIAEEKAAKMLARLDIAPVANALEELARIGGQCVAWKDKMAGKVNELTEIGWSSQVAGEQVRREIILWERALDRCVHVLSAMARLNLDERLAQIEERKAEMIALALSESLAHAGVTPVQAKRVRAEFVNRLRILRAA